MIEKWKEIENSKNYAISNLGRIKRTSHYKIHNINKTFFKTKDKLLKPSNNNAKKYWRICIFYNDDTKTYCSVHRLVANAFIANPYNLPQVNHIDGDKNNNHVDNLEWCTGFENMQHRINVLNIKPWKKGEDCGFSKLTQEQVLLIPELLKNNITKKAISKIFNVVPSTITEITSGRSWKHLKLFE